MYEVYPDAVGVLVFIGLGVVGFSYLRQLTARERSWRKCVKVAREKDWVI